MKTVVRILAGSHLYGTNVEGSDEDHKVIFIPSGRDILLQKVKDAYHKKPGEGIDLEFWSLQKFLHLACMGQVVAIDLLFAPAESFVGEHSAVWDEIQANRDQFVSKNCSAFVEYCRQQAKKYIVRRERLISLQHAVGYFTSLVDKFPNPATIKLTEVDTIEEFAAANGFTDLISLETAQGHQLQHLSVCDTMVPITASVKVAYGTYKRKLENYGKRVAAAAEGEGDWKSLYHAVRVGYQAIELLTTGKLTFPRPEKDVLLAIRQGRMSFEATQALIETNLVRVEEELERTGLPEKPNTALANALVEKYYRWAVEEE